MHIRGCLKSVQPCPMRHRHGWLDCLRTALGFPGLGCFHVPRGRNLCPIHQVTGSISLLLFWKMYNVYHCLNGSENHVIKTLV